MGAFLQGAFLHAFKWKVVMLYPLQQNEGWVFSYLMIFVHLKREYKTLMEKFFSKQTKVNNINLLGMHRILQ